MIVSSAYPLIRTVAAQLAGAAYVVVGLSGCGGSDIVSPTLTEPLRLEARIESAGAGAQRSCALVATGAVHCWGLTAQPDDWTATPTPVAGAEDLITLSQGAFHTCGLTDAGRTLCWGGELLWAGQWFGRAGDDPHAARGRRRARLRAAGGRRLSHVRS
jgi:hypothetical protein